MIRFASDWACMHFRSKSVLLIWMLAFRFSNTNCRSSGNIAPMNSLKASLNGSSIKTVDRETLNENVEQCIVHVQGRRIMIFSLLVRTITLLRSHPGGLPALTVYYPSSEKLSSVSQSSVFCMCVYVCVFVRACVCVFACARQGKWFEAWEDIG